MALRHLQDRLDAGGKKEKKPEEHKGKDGHRVTGFLMFFYSNTAVFGCLNISTKAKPATNPIDSNCRPPPRPPLLEESFAIALWHLGELEPWANEELRRAMDQSTHKIS